MATPTAILDISAADMNDSAQENYTDDLLLPYFNMALFEFLERLEESNIPITNKRSTILTIPINTPRIAFVGTTPLLPAGLIEVQQVWESTPEQNSWAPMQRRDFINPQSLVTPINRLNEWMWEKSAILIPPANVIITMKIDFIDRILNPPLGSGALATDLDVKGCELFLGHKTAALCSMFSLQDTDRSMALNQLAEEAIGRRLNIPIKGQQAITTRRRPFRAGYKTTGRF